MVPKRLVSLALCAASVTAFRDASPFFLFSTSTLSQIDSLPPQQVAKSSSISPSILDSFVDCPSEAYVIVSQLGVSSVDFANEKGAPHLRRRLSKRHEDTIKSVYSVPDVLGSIRTSELEKYLVDKCAAKPMHIEAEAYKFALTPDYPKLIKVDFPELPVDADKRQFKIAMLDSFLDSILNELSGKSYTVIYTTTPPNEETLANLEKQKEPTLDTEDAFGDTGHIELKRNMNGRVKRQSENDNDRGLFEKYNFLSPGIFMAGIVAILLFLILYVGITAVSGLEVSYAAFSKENGPAAQKKQQ